MIKVRVCHECNGEGEYAIYNAYDPDFKEIIGCEYCFGSGMLGNEPLIKPESKNGRDPDWSN